MIIMQPQVLVPEDQLDGEIIKRLERYGRVCYKSENIMSSQGNPDFLSGKLKLGHESIIEHEKVTLMFVCDRGITHEIVRHRIAAYSQESTRYCNYSKDKFGREISVIEPYFFKDDPGAYDLWARACQGSEDAYMALLDAGCKAQEARSVLPTCLKTEIVVTYNMREWRHFFRLRCDAASHPQMRQVAIPLLLLFKEHFPALYGDIPYDKSFPREHYAKIILTNDLFEPL
ncbi:MAG: FAD-dependent thymidylate synthase [Deltaproteobacteria bacterium]